MGHWKQVLTVDLDRGDVETRDLSPPVHRAYLGGAGFTPRLLYDAVGSGVDPLGPARAHRSVGGNRHS